VIDKTRFQSTKINLISAGSVEMHGTKRSDTFAKRPDYYLTKSHHLVD
jgi:hypothetical protein